MSWKVSETPFIGLTRSYFYRLPVQDTKVYFPYMFADFLSKDLSGGVAHYFRGPAIQELLLAGLTIVYFN